ncbi:twitching motility protein [Jonesia denitrificans DSM 20603]|uniref:Twitching motility protein n=1 Tax=Jonesia denitrificans (strain ATCC 14870 / DSM 20603 / BCRC 15368 / CIP 55.134 / JCM 11481 / NBRC 15587 / NCTC 10816 / Prevot 55134) TaxID=471856 RepID=C7QZF3_JONDD|nr:twitching motility protein [Jonesia denitrificans DSM 20603]SQH21802.1 Twitching mobility protein [Jonesia denitrificans]
MVGCFPCTAATLTSTLAHGDLLMSAIPTYFSIPAPVCETQGQTSQVTRDTLRAGAGWKTVKFADQNADVCVVSLEQSVIPLLHALVSTGGSDLHIKAGSVPRVRVDGRLRRLQVPDLTDGDTARMLEEVLPEQLHQEFLTNHETDFAYYLQGVGRFRVNAYRARGMVGIVFRRVAEHAMSLHELGLPEVVGELALEPRGLVLVTGPTGSGKSTTLASMVDLINTLREVNIVTIEDPIEVLHSDKKAIVSQREVRFDTADFNSALRAAMRQDPDVILVGEMRDAETVRAALQAGETGHLVLSTLHTIDAEETVNRIVDFFPSHEQMQVRMALAQSLRGIVSQRLVRRADNEGRHVVAEVMINTGRTAEAIIAPSTTASLTDLIADGEYYNMQTFDQHLFGLVRDGVVRYEDACTVASNPQDLTIELRGAGLIM